MPERKAVRRVDSPEIQGDDSWVKLRAFTVEEARQHRTISAREGYDDFEYGLSVIGSHIVDWNWVDDDGKPLPKPCDDPDVIGRLTDFETRWLMQQLRGPSEAELKN